MWTLSCLGLELFCLSGFLHPNSVFLWGRTFYLPLVLSSVPLMDYFSFSWLFYDVCYRYSVCGISSSPPPQLLYFAFICSWQRVFSLRVNKFYIMCALVFHSIMFKTWSSRQIVKYCTSILLDDHVFGTSRRLRCMMAKLRRHWQFPRQRLCWGQQGRWPVWSRSALHQDCPLLTPPPPPAPQPLQLSRLSPIALTSTLHTSTSTTTLR